MQNLELPRVLQFTDDDLRNMTVADMREAFAIAAQVIEDFTSSSNFASCALTDVKTSEVAFSLKKANAALSIWIAFSLRSASGLFATLFCDSSDPLQVVITSLALLIIGAP